MNHYIARTISTLMGIRLIGFSQLGWAANWVPLAVPQPYLSLAYDRDRVVVSGEKVTYWRLVELTPAQIGRTGRVKRALYRERIDCTEHTLSVLAYYLQGEDGLTLESNTVGELEGQVIPDSYGDLLEKVLCYYVRDSGAISQRITLDQVQALSSANGSLEGDMSDNTELFGKLASNFLSIRTTTGGNPLLAAQPNKMKISPVWADLYPKNLAQPKISFPALPTLPPPTEMPASVFPITGF